MSYQSWQVLTWPRVFFTLWQWRALVARTGLLDATRIETDNASGRRVGTVLWGGIDSNRRFGMAWDWAEVMPGVVAMSDPMRIVSNIMLVDSEGNCLPPNARLLHLNSAIASLCWQPAVIRAAEAELVHA